ncbi:MAG: zinc ABC transporter substrate-binding protein [Clostridiales bacterium]|nr:zinc ABC transporter substrate-binding protein [Clostridiales bacterium]
MHKDNYSGGSIVKKLISVLAAAAMMAGCLCGCNAAQKANTSDKMKIVTTIFPEYDWVNNILGDKASNAEVTMLLDNGVDLHSFQPTAADILKISECDLFIYVGGESDEWVEDVLKEATNKDMIAINLLEVLGDKVVEEEIVEGMQEEEEDEDHDHEHEDEDHDHEHEDHDHEHEDEDEHEHEHKDIAKTHEHHHDEVEYDEHVWLSLRNSAILVNSISEAIQKIDPANAESYKANAASYIEKLNALDKEYQAAVSAASKNTILFGDRFPFRYLVEDYNLEYYAAFVGCSAESEASFETIVFLAGKVDELSLPAVLTIEGRDHSIAQTIVENTAAKDQKILTMDSMQSTTSEDIKNGASYLSIMESNLSVLKEALG